MALPKSIYPKKVTDFGSYKKFQYVVLVPVKFKFV